MATAPVAYQSALIESLRAASPGFTSNNPGVTMLANPANSKTVLDFKRTPIQPYLPPGPVVGPPLPPGPTPAPPPPLPPVIGPGGPGGPPVIGPGPGPSSPPLPPAPPDLDPAPDVPDYTDDLWPPVEPDPVEESVAESFPVPDPGPIYTEELPPLDPVAEPFPVPDQPPLEFFDMPPLDDSSDVAQPFPVPDPSPWEPVDLPPLDDFVGPMPDDFVGPMPDDFVGPMPDDFVGPPVPEYDEIPEGEIDVGPPGNSEPARDAIDQIGDITEIGDLLDELGDIELPDPVIDLPLVPPAAPEYDEVPQEETDVGPVPDEFVGPVPDDFVGPMPDEFVGPPAPEYDEVPQGEIDVGPPGSSDPARDAIDQIGDVTEVGDLLDEFRYVPDDFVGPMPEFDLPTPDIVPPEFLPPEPDMPGDENVFTEQLPSNWDSFSADDEIDLFDQNDASVNELLEAGVPPSDVESMLQDGYEGGVAEVPDYTNDLWGPEDPALSQQDLIEMTLFEMMTLDLLTGGGGGSGGPMNNMNILAYE